MTTIRVIGTTIGFTVGISALTAQIGGGGGYGIGAARGGGGVPAEYQFQQVGTIGPAAGGGRGPALPAKTSAATPMVGRPVSATEERKSVQTLSDGTEISTSETSLYYRDSQGRERTETTVQGRTTVQIVDRVGGFNITLNPANKTARRTPLAGNLMQVFMTTQGTLFPQAVPAAASTDFTAVAVPVATTPPAAGGGGGRGGRGGRGGLHGDNMSYEELGVHSLNGVLATGTRSTMIIPLGQIGNNRDIHVLNEQWYSEDLQMLVKSVNSDPRFGENTYELTDISRVEPDPALFQIPAEYTILEGGRGQVGQQGGPVQPATPRVIK